MRGGKKGSRKGRERVLVENEDDIIARNMMVRVLVYLLILRKEKKRREIEEMMMKKNLKKIRILTIPLMLMSLMKSLL